MNPTTKRQHERPRERGGILAFTGMALLTLIGMTVVGVDLGRLAFTATEVQTVAEVAATGYAHAWLRGVSAGGNPSDGTCAGEALGVVAGNRIDGQQAIAANIEGYERGFYDFDTNGPFSAAVPAGETANAVRATATATVNNFFAAVFGSSQSTVRKNAVATLTCGSRARPLPLAVGDCQFGGFDGPEDCADLEALTQQNVNIDNSCWTSLSTDDSANTDTLRGFIETICGTASTPPPEVGEGDSVAVTEGNHTPLCTAVQNCYDAGITEFTVPIVACSEAIQCAAGGTNTLTVSGFARIELSSRPVCTGSPKFISLAAFCNTDPTEGVGGNCDFGNFKVAMVE